jgi:transposase
MNRSVFCLAWYIDGLKQRSGLDIQLSIPEDFGRAPRDMELGIFRLIQECLTNTHCHSGATKASWFEAMLAKLGHELWVGDSAEIRAAMVRKQKTDVRDALHILDLMLANRFPRIWIPSPADRDVRQLLRHRHKMVCLR